MTLEPKNFGSPKMPGGSILIHGINNAGKTKLIAAALKYFSDEGKVSMAMFDEEQGESSAADLGLDDLGYQVLWTVDSIDDYLKWVEKVEKEKPIATATDSLWATYRAIQRKKTGGERPPAAGETSNNEWPWIHNDAHNIMKRVRKSAKWVLFACPSDSGHSTLKDVESGIKTKDQMIMPDLNGKMAEGCVAWFNLVGYLMCDTIKDGMNYKMKRTLSFLPSKHYKTRQRMPYPIDHLITIPEYDPIGGWKNVIKAADSAYAKAYNKAGKGSNA